jgi:D-amino-acid oxidase
LKITLWFILHKKFFKNVMERDIAVIEAGISGMATAFLLTQNGYRVTIYAKAFSPDITSNKAAAFWFP